MHLFVFVVVPTPCRHTIIDIKFITHADSSLYHTLV